MKHFNTLGTLVRFWLSVLERRLGISLTPASVQGIGSYVPISDRIATSGQPSPAQIAAIGKAGFRTVINLAPANSSNAVADEALLVAAAGMRYVHIPVVWGTPTEQDFDRFRAAMAESEDTKTFIHCAANMRVSAFVYRYRRDVLGVPEDVARADLNRIWQPTGVWADFIRSRAH